MSSTQYQAGRQAAETDHNEGWIGKESTATELTQAAASQDPQDGGFYDGYKARLIELGYQP